MSDAVSQNVTPSRLDGVEKRLISALENLATLRITTVVGKVNVEIRDGADGSDRLNVVVKSTNEPGAECATTSINLIGGDITEIRTEKFAVDGEYAKTHDAAVANATKIISSNIETMKQALASLRGLLAR